MRQLRALLLVAALPACLEVPEAPAPECTTTDDCSGNEICDDGTCWGDPPMGEFAFVISPPVERSDLVSREVMRGMITLQGDIEGLELENPVELDARIGTMCTPPLVCAREMLTASVTITRPSLFDGGPGFKLVTMTDTSTSGEPAFVVKVPPGDPDLPYVVTIVPTPRGDMPASSSNLAEVVPPMRFEMPLTADTTKTLTLGGLSLPTVEGTLLAAAGGGLEDYRVVAMGRWQQGGPPTEVSTVSYTGSNGAFHLTLSPNLVGTVEIVARPSDPLLGKPTLHLLDVPTAVGVQRTLKEPAELGTLVDKPITIKMREGGGAPKPVVGARVRVTALIGSAAEGTATFVAEETTDESGTARLKVLGGNAILGEYKLEVVPPASSRARAIYNEPFAMTSSEIQLVERTRLAGKVLDANGDALPGVTVTARPALRFLWSLDDKPQTFLNSVPVATAVTDNDGAFVIWVDPLIDETWGYYDLALDPARSTGFLERLPTFVKTEVEIPRDSQLDQVNLEPIRLPDAAFVRGEVVDSTARPVPGAEVKIFRMNSSIEAICSSVRNAPKPCPASSTLLGRGAANSSGNVELTLPR
ncbi:MAG: hypothetical protein AB7L94_30890 [Kofleriaceae bacterium]